MATFKMDLEIDWIDEDSSIDETIKQEIIGNIESKVTRKIYEKVLESAESKIMDKVDSMVNDAVSDRIESFLSKPRDVTDKWGEVIKEGVTVESLLTEKLEQAMSKKTLNKDGKPDNYHAKYSAFDFMAMKNIGEIVDARIAVLVGETKVNIEQMVTDKIKTQVADKLTNMIMENSETLTLKAQ